MKRRLIFIGASSVAILAGGTYAYRRMMAGMGEMSGMDHGGDSKQVPRILALPEGRSLPELRRLPNLATTPNTFSGELTIAQTAHEFAPSLQTQVFSYNGLIPGPLVELNEGDAVTIKVNNKLDRDTTVHWHGLDIPSDQDGNPMDPIKPGATRSYAFSLIGDNTGPFWYHPHPHKDTPEQTFLGLAGALIVRPKVDPLKDLEATTLFVSSVSLLQDGRIAPNAMADLMNGREGDHVLVNGEKNPTLTVAPGSSRRFRIYNATNGRYLRISFENMPMTLVGSDGGYLAAPVIGLQEILLAPAERAEVIVTFDKETGTTALNSLEYDRGWMGPAKSRTSLIRLMTIKRSGVAESAFTLPKTLREIAQLPKEQVSRRIEFGEKMGMGLNGMSMQFLINGKTFDANRTDFFVKRNQVELWEIANPTDMDHPLHIHGTQFQVIQRERTGARRSEPFMQWKDTVNVARGETVRLRVKWMLAGKRMFHCHILEHEQLGMMGIADVA